MDDWFREISATSTLPEDVALRLQNDGYIILDGPVPPERFAPLSEAYDRAILQSDPSDVSVRASTRVHDFVNRGPEFDELYVYAPILAACCLTIGRPFKLSSLLARTLEPGAPAQNLHVDFEREADGYPMIGFILMIDEFSSENGATRFLRGSQRAPYLPADIMRDTTADCAGQVLALGSAGSMIIYNGSAWHGHTANRSDRPRRSIQGAFIRREAESAINQAERIRPETLGRIGGLAKYLLDLEAYRGAIA